jgi:hypothetical protein
MSRISSLFRVCAIPTPSSINDRRPNVITIDRAVVPALRVLIVDDSSLVRMYYRDALEKAVSKSSRP